MSRKGDKLAKARRKIAALEREIVRLSPAGSESRDLLPETRSGVGDKATTFKGTDTPLPDPATGELSALAREWKKEAAESDEESGHAERRKDEFERVWYKADAAARYDCASQLMRLLSEPRAQSDTEEVEECPTCRPMRLNSMGLEWKCEDCGASSERARRKREERSVPPNEPAQAAPHPNQDR